jgi:hypothetical protein
MACRDIFNCFIELCQRKDIVSAISILYVITLHVTFLHYMVITNNETINVSSDKLNLKISGERTLHTFYHQ